MKNVDVSVLKLFIIAGRRNDWSLRNRHNDSGETFHTFVPADRSDITSRSRDIATTSIYSNLHIYLQGIYSERAASKNFDRNSESTPSHITDSQS